MARIVETDSTKPRWPQLTALIVTCNSSQVLTECVKNLHGAARILIVDNASTDATCEIAATLGSNVQIIKNDKNLGFGTANNIGFGKVETEFLMMINPDALISPPAIDKLLSYMGTDRHAGIVAPLLRNAAGSLELPVMGRWEINHQGLARSPDGPFCTWFVTGALWLCRTKAWAEISGFDENIFLYNEDTDFCLRLAKAGFSMVIRPDVSALHEGGKSTPATRSVRYLKDWHRTWSHLYMEAKYGLPADARRLAWKIVRLRLTKALLYVFLMRPQRVAGNWAKASAAMSFLKRPAR